MLKDQKLNNRQPLLTAWGARGGIFANARPQVKEDVSLLACPSLIRRKEQIACKCPLEAMNCMLRDEFVSNGRKYMDALLKSAAFNKNG